ncbi:MAG: hypothetical protein ACYC27_12955 [Armatimonadota bacterium]
MRNRYIAVLIAIMAVCMLSSACFSAADDNKLPTWPQSFSIATNGRASFAFPAAQPGKIIIDAKWSGGQLSIVVMNGAGNAVTDANPKSSPTHIEYTATAADIQKGIIWNVVISDPRKPAPSAANNPAAFTGQINILYPAVDIVSITPRLNTIRSQKRIMPGTLPDNLKALKNTRLPDSKPNFDIPSHVKMLEQNQKQLYSSTINKITASIAPIKRIQQMQQADLLIASNLGPNIKKIPKEMPEPFIAPVLVSIDKISVYAGDEVGVCAQQVDANIDTNEVYFTMSANIIVKAEMISAQKYGASNVILRVKVPEELANMKSNSAMPVFVKKISPTNAQVFATSNTQTVNYICRYVPRIDQVDPTSLTSKQNITLYGDYFRTNAKVHFAFADGRNDTVIYKGNSSKQITVASPFYQSSASLPVLIYIDDEIQGRPVRSNMVQVEFTATEPKITSISPTQGGPNDVITFYGTGLKRICEVHFEPDPGQESKILPVANNVSCRANWFLPGGSDTQFLTKLANGLQGIKSPVTGKLIIKYDMFTKTAPPIPFTFKPQIVSRPLYEAFIPTLSSFQKKDGGDTYSQIVNPADWATRMPPYNWLMGYHYSSLFEGHGGDDYYVINAPLKNGWTLDYLRFNTSGNGGSTGARQEGWSQDSAGRPVIKVHWWVDAPCRSLWYEMIPYIKGPNGVPYK